VKKQASPKLVAVSLLVTLTIVLVVYYRAFLVEPKQQGQMRMMGGGGPPPPPPAGIEAAKVTTLAGCPIPGYQEGQGREARFDGPSALAVDPAGGVYVADSRNHRIRHITPEGKVTTVAGGGPVGTVRGGYRDGPALEARFWNPSGLALDQRGFLYVADSGNHCLRRLSPDGRVATVAGAPGPPDATGLPSGGYRDGPAAAARFRSPAGLAFDAAGNLYIADVGNHCLRRLSPQGQVTTVAGQPGEKDATGRPAGAFADGPGPQARFRNPVSVAWAPDGKLLVADAGNSCVRVVTPEGTVRTLPIPHLAPPAGTADWLPPVADPRGNPAPHGVRLLEPAGIAVDSQNRIFVSDTYVNCIFKLDSAATLPAQPSPPGLLLAGIYHEGSPPSGHRDGTGASCAFARPAALAWAPGGVLYVADFGNDCVRRVTVP
jgi:DNA-binding beta-propeller fold protein YncE